MSVLNALKWSFLSEVASKAIQPIIFIVLARLLAPEDFGVMTAAVMVIAFTQFFWEAGMGQALIQRQTDIDKTANIAFWINVSLGLLITAILFLFAKSIAQTFFRDDRVTLVLQVMTLQILLGSLSSVHTALLQKQMGFKKLFWVRFATISLPGIASIPLALHGFGHWALVAGTLVGQMAQTLLLWKISKWRPRLMFDIKHAREVGKFGVWVCITGFLTWFYQWADALIVGMYLGSHDLGLYKTGNQFVQLIFTLFFSPAMPVLYSWLVKKNKTELSRELTNIVTIIALISIPLSIAIYAFAGIIGLFFFGKNWGGVDTVIAVMALSHGISYIFIANGEAYRAAGKPHYETAPMALGLLIFLPVYIYFITYGLETFLYARLTIVILFGVVIHAFLAWKNFNISPVVFIKFALITLFFTLLTFYLDRLFLEIETSPITKALIYFLLAIASAVYIYFSNLKIFNAAIKRIIWSRRLLKI